MTSTGDAYLDNFSGEPLDLLVYIANRTVQEKDRVTLTATVSTGVAPYTYVWKMLCRKWFLRRSLMHSMLKYNCMYVDGNRCMGSYGYG